MNRVILCGRLTRDTEIRYSQTVNGSTAVARYTLAVDRDFKKMANRQQTLDYAAVLKEAKSMECNEIRALYNILLENMELIVHALETVGNLTERKI